MDVSGNQARCETCCYWNPISDFADKGECRLSAPIISENGTTWPITDPTSSCAIHPENTSSGNNEWKRKLAEKIVFDAPIAVATGLSIEAFFNSRSPKNEESYQILSAILVPEFLLIQIAKGDFDHFYDYGVHASTEEKLSIFMSKQLERLIDNRADILTDDLENINIGVFPEMKIDVLEKVGMPVPIIIRHYENIKFLHSICEVSGSLMISVLQRFADYIYDSYV